MRRFQYKKQSHGTPGFLISICVFLLIMAFFIYEISTLSDSTTARQRDTLENAITHSIIYCYSVEGAYPESLDYLKENYGLTYNEDLFYVDYRILGSNIMPDVTIIKKED
ncbi:MAG: hypothetical protein ACOCNL_13230 [Acetivibrio ethanolgignens]